MDSTIVIVVASVVALVVGALGMNVFRNLLEQKRKNQARNEADKILAKAKSEAQRLEADARKKAKDLEVKLKRDAEQEIERTKKNLENSERSFRDKEKTIEQRKKELEDQAQDKIRKIGDREERVKVLETRYTEQTEKTAKLNEDLKQKLVSVANLSTDQAKRELIEAVRSEAEVEASKVAARIEEDAKINAEAKAKRIIGIAISRYSGEYVAEKTVSVVQLPDEETKGKIIGREGRNIRALEQACGVDLIVDDTPEAVVISAFDPVRRELARRTLEKLVEDGRIHPTRIEEILEKEKRELFRSIKTDGEKACYDLGLVGVHEEILKLIGSLKYRTSYTQNNYPHSIEVGFIGGMMAAELGVDIKIARRASLLHDIGKALDHSVAGSHAVIGADFAKKYGESEAVVHAIRAHHEDEKPNSVYAHIAQAADALSGARPGARRQMMETYINRLEDLESISNSFDGVIRSYALQAGREIRVIVEGSKVTDDMAVMLSRDIARKIESEMTYPGQIKVTVIREVRAIDHAR